ncbi:MAG: ABC transporter permease [Planctomycetota bacterium]
MSEPAKTTSSPAPPRRSLGTVLRPLFALAGPLLALVAVIILFAVVDQQFADGTFCTVRNLRTVTVQTCVVAVAALGMTVIIISGGIDLSTGTALALCATTLAWGLREDVGYLAFQRDNFARASTRFEEAQKRQAAVRNAANNQRSQESSAVGIQPGFPIPEDAVVNQERGRLHLILLQKIAQLPEGPERQALQSKADALQDLNFRLTVNPKWLEGIPNSPWTAPLSVWLGIATGVLAGLVNGILIGLLKLKPFVVSLGTMTIFLGLGNLLSNNVPIRPSLNRIPSWLADLDGNTPDALWGGFPTGVWLALALALTVAAVLRYTVFGRYVFALGSNESTARLCGINVTGWKIAIYAIGGLFFGIAGVYQFTRLSTGAPMSGVGLELEIIAAVVIGGGSLSGGRGTILGTLAGAAMTAVIKSGCTQLGLADALQRIIIGAIIIGAVSIDQYRQQRLDAS